MWESTSYFRPVSIKRERTYILAHVYFGTEEFIEKTNEEFLQQIFIIGKNNREGESIILDYEQIPKKAV
jgi:hypothetical protein